MEVTGARRTVPRTVPLYPAPQHPEPLRLVGLDLEYIADYRRDFSRNSALYRALDEHVQVVGRMSPTLSPGQKFLNRLGQIHPNLSRWRRNAGFNPQLFQKRTVVAGEYLAARRGEYDVVLQTYLQFAPAPGTGGAPYGVYLDATFDMSRRHYPGDHPLPRAAMDRWMALERETYHRAARLFPWSDFTARSLIEEYGCDPAQVVRVGAGTNLMAPSLDGKRYEEPVALFVGMDFDRKGGQDVLRAFQDVRARLPDAQLWIVGPRLPKAPPQPGVHWLGRIADREKLAELYSRARVFVMPSFEPWGHVFCEAMGHGLPCIALNRGPAAEIVQDRQTGLLVGQGDREQLGEALHCLLNDAALAERLGRAAYRRVQEQYTWAHVVQRLLPHLTAMARGE